MPDSILIPVEPAAKTLGVCRSTVYNLMESGELASIRIGRRRLIERAELERFVAEKRQVVA